MQLVSYRPQRPLAYFVDRLWLSFGAAPLHQMERLLPDGTVELVINLYENRIQLYDRDQRHCGTVPGALVSGPRTQYFVIDTQDQVATMGVHFRPGGAFPFFRLPALELADQSLSLDSLWGSAASAMRERLLAAVTPQRKFWVLEACLLEQVAKPLERHPAVTFGIQQLRGYGRSVAEVVDKAGFSQRRFIQLFGDQVGLTPKVFSRVSRFQQVVRIAHGADEIDWADLALECGYYDQAHFIHDFQSFAGITPATYLAQRTRHLNHVPLT